MESGLGHGEIMVGKGRKITLFGFLLCVLVLFFETHHMTDVLGRYTFKIQMFYHRTKFNKTWLL